MKVALLFISSLLLFAFTCNKKTGDSCISYLTAPVIEAVGPTTGSVNQDIAFSVTYGVGNGCGTFFKFEESVAGNNAVIKVIAKFEGCICTAIYSEFTNAYIFKKTVPGTYQLQFDKGDGNFITREIVIQ